MSFKVDGASDYFEATLATSLNEPFWMGCFYKYVTWPSVLQTGLGLGNDVNAGASSHQHRLVPTTTNRWSFHSIDTAAGPSAPNFTEANDNTWIGVVGVKSAENSSAIYVRTIGNVDTSAFTCATSALWQIRMCRQFNGGAYFGAASPNESRVAEPAIWSGVPTTQMITDYLNRIQAADIDPSNLRFYVPMATNSLLNLGTDTAGDLVAFGDAVFDSDHPIISAIGGGGGRRLGGVPGMRPVEIGRKSGMIYKERFKYRRGLLVPAW